MKTNKNLQACAHKRVGKKTLAKTMKAKSQKRRGPPTSKLGHFRPKTEVTTLPTQTGYREWKDDKLHTFNQEFNTWDNEIVTKIHKATFCGRKITVEDEEKNNDKYC